MASRSHLSARVALTRAHRGEALVATVLRVRARGLSVAGKATLLGLLANGSAHAQRFEAGDCARVRTLPDRCATSLNAKEVADVLAGDN